METVASTTIDGRLQAQEMLLYSRGRTRKRVWRHRVQHRPRLVSSRVVIRLLQGSFYSLGVLFQTAHISVDVRYLALMTG